MRFGGLVAINDFSFRGKRGEITALIGPNGAGKTTVFNCVTGFYKPTEGMIRLVQQSGKEYLLERMPDFRIASRAKVARTFQNIRLFGGMTVLENLLVAQHNKLMVASGMSAVRHPRAARLQEGGARRRREGARLVERGRSRRPRR